MYRVASSACKALLKQRYGGMGVAAGIEASKERHKPLRKELKSERDGSAGPVLPGAVDFPSNLRD